MDKMKNTWMFLTALGSSILVLGSGVLFVDIVGKHFGDALVCFTGIIFVSCSVLYSYKQYRKLGENSETHKH